MLYPTTFPGGSLARPLYATEFTVIRGAFSELSWLRKERNQAVQCHCWQEELQQPVVPNADTLSTRMFPSDWAEIIWSYMDGHLGSYVVFVHGAGS
jgi:hypothetical protein